MRSWQRHRLAQAALLALGSALAGPVSAQSVADLVKEIQALKARVAELEARPQAPATAAPPTAQWGMTPEQAADLNRVQLKTEAMEDARDAMGFKGLKISGYVDPTYIYNKAQNRAGFQFLNKVDTNSGGDGYNYDNSYFGAAVIDFQKETDSGTRWRLTLAPNRGVGSVFDTNSPIHEASVSVPLSDSQTRLIAGQLPDWSGYEFLPATQNKLITHNLLFDFTLPTAYTGAGVELADGKWIYKAVLANMNTTQRSSGNKSPVLAYRVDYAKGEFSGFGFAGVHGKTANPRYAVQDADGHALFPDRVGHDTRVDLFEVDGYFSRGDWTVQGQASVGRQRDAAVALAADGSFQDARWWGLSGLVAYKGTPRFETTARLDYLANHWNGGGLLTFATADSRNGIGPGVNGDPQRGANRSALTLGASYLFNPSTTFKAEYRLDRASQPVFEDVKTGEFKKANHLLGASVLVAF